MKGLETDFRGCMAGGASQVESGWFSPRARGQRNAGVLGMDDKRRSEEMWFCVRSESPGWDGPEQPHAGFTKRTSRTMHWSIPWSDLMMTMFILFVFMYIYHAPKGKVLPGQGMTPVAAIPDPISDLYDISRQTVRANALEDFASVDLVPNKAVRIVLAGDLLFDTGKADLRPTAKQSLRSIADIVRRTPYMVNVVGHTDDVPIHSEKFPSNWELSAMRACQVARFLMEETTLSEKRFFISGHANHQPVLANTSDANRAANRRVEIIITRERPAATPGITEDIFALNPLEGPHRSSRELWPWNTF